MSNNKQSMKLYTEEQVNELRRALKDVVQWDEFLEDDWEDAGYRAMDALRCFEMETPIELPSDEEIEQEAHIQYPVNSQPIGRTLAGGKYDVDINYSERNAFLKGVKFILDKIQGGNNDKQ